jgi:hypothetical protein
MAWDPGSRRAVCQDPESKLTSESNLGRPLLASAVCCLLFAACQLDPASFAERHTKPEEREFARYYLELLERGRADSAFALVVPELQTAHTREQVAQVSSFLAAHPVDSLHMIGVHVNTTPGLRNVNLSWQYRSAGQWVLASVAAQHSAAGSRRVVGVNVHLAERSMTELNRFTVRDRSLLHIFWLLIAVLNPLICIATAIRTATAAGMPKRWGWAVASLVGVFTLTLDWTTGAVNVNPVAFTLLGAGFIRPGPAAPWMISISFPLGAALALRQYRAWRRAPRPIDAASPSESAV